MLKRASFQKRPCSEDFFMKMPKFEQNRQYMLKSFRTRVKLLMKVVNISKSNVVAL
jgi:hypothetical protein